MNYHVALMMTLCVCYLIGFVLVMIDVKNHYSETYKELGGDTVFFRPFKQLDFLLWIIIRKYARISGSNFHRYDIFLMITVSFVVSILSFAVIDM